MHHITSYLYDNKIDIQILDTSLVVNTRNRVVYSRPVKFYQGIDNPVVFEIKNQDQKPVDITWLTVDVIIQDPTSKTSVATFTVENVDAIAGLARFTVPQALVNALDQRFYKLTIRTTSQITGLEQPAYIDQNYSASLDLEVLPAFYPPA